MHFFGTRYKGIFMCQYIHNTLFCPLASISSLTAKTHTNSDQTTYTAEVTIQDKSSTTNDPITFLAYHGRKLDSVLGDGNCMFRSLAKQLSGDSDKHAQLRDKL